ncbi:MAG: 16S rRNA (guanine(527)-N(7))-methyltransferase RsmG [Xanthomonadales bacterium]|nr:16S rRNA (guanine(527)-N(7))-methyltransferase RsmG [Xanthomonadales bacterium]
MTHAFPDLSAELDQGLAALGLDLPAPARRQLLDYLALLAHWNRRINLTAVREPREMLIRHLLDSLAVLPWLHGRRIADLGAGPGLPGIPLAIARPDLDVTLVDSNGKMARFQREAVRQLGLQGRCHPVQDRVEAFAPAPDRRFDTVLSRAYAPLDRFIASSRHLVAPEGRWLALKGQRPDAEIAALPADIRVEAVQALAVPGLAGQRHAIIMAGPAPG